MINSPNLLKRLEAIPPSPLQRLLRFDLYFSAPVQTLIILRRLSYQFDNSDTFPCSNNPIFAYTLRCHALSLSVL